MINPKQIDRLFFTMSRDMKISRFEGEDDVSSRNRILYSGLGKWIMQLFADRDFEEEENNQVTKAHVTISALDVVRSFKKICPNAIGFFSDEKGTINEIEDIYLAVGYINSGTYNFKYPSKRQKINMGVRSLVIDLDTNVTRFCGLGVYGAIKESDISLDDYYLTKDNALDYFKNIVKQLKYEKANFSYGKNEIYNVEKNRWDYFNDKEANKYEYSIVKVDDGLDYKIVKKQDDELYSASLPAIYSHPGDSDLNFKREVWRVILGLCCYNQKPAIAHIEDYHKDGIKIDFGGYVMPFNEYALFKCIAWPINTSLEIGSFAARKDMLEPILSLLNHLSINAIVEVQE